MSTNARVVRQTEGRPLLLEVPTDHACIVLEPSGAVDLGLLPQDEDGRPTEGSSVAQALVIGMLDPEFAPELRALLARIRRRHFGERCPVMQ